VMLNLNVIGKAVRKERVKLWTMYSEERNNNFHII